MAQREVFQQTVSIIDQLRNTVIDYEAGTSILYELLQNADDAGATHVRFCMDLCDYGNGPKRLKTDLFDTTALKPCLGPALLAYNNETFSKRDYENIASVARQGKADEVHKIGKFGVGFNSVYHFTDLPSFVSGSQFSASDPHCLYINRGHPGLKFMLPSITPQQRGDMMCYDVFSGADEIIRRAGIYRGLAVEYPPTPPLFAKPAFPGTVFRFPLRTAEVAANSDILKQVATVKALKEKFEYIMQAPASSLLFLRNVQTIELFSNSPDRGLQLEGAITILNSTQAYHGPHGAEYPPIKMQRARFVEALSAARANPARPTEIVDMRMAILVYDAITDPREPETRHEHWFVEQRVGHPDLAELAVANSARTYAGVAINIDGQVKGTAFCSLPLPLETGLSVHINALLIGAGSFHMPPNRRMIDWETHEGKTSAAIEWNRKLVGLLISPALIHAKLAMQELHLLAADDFYICGFPLATVAQHAFVKEIARRFYVQGWTEKLFRVPGADGHHARFLTGREVCFLPAEGSAPPIGLACVEALTHFRMTDCPRIIVAELSAMPGNFISESTNQLCPALMRKILTDGWASSKDRVRAVVRTPADVAALLTYCALNLAPGERIDRLKPLPLLLTGVGLQSLSDTCVCVEKDDFLRDLLAQAPQLMLEPSLESHDVIRLLVNAPGSALQTLSVKLLGTIMDKVLDPQTCRPSSSRDGMVAWDRRLPSPEWLQLCWRFLNLRCIGKTNEDRTAVLAALGDWALVPVRGNHLYRLRDAGQVINLSAADPALGELLSALNCAVFDEQFANAEFLTTFLAGDGLAGVVSALAAPSAQGQLARITEAHASVLYQYFVSNKGGLASLRAAHKTRLCTMKIWPQEGSVGDIHGLVCFVDEAVSQVFVRTFSLVVVSARRHPDMLEVAKALKRPAEIFSSGILSFVETFVLPTVQRLFAASPALNKAYDVGGGLMLSVPICSELVCACLPYFAKLSPAAQTIILQHPWVRVQAAASPFVPPLDCVDPADDVLVRLFGPDACPNVPSATLDAMRQSNMLPSLAMPAGPHKAYVLERCVAQLDALSRAGSPAAALRPLAVAVVLSLSGQLSDATTPPRPEFLKAAPKLHFLPPAEAQLLRGVAPAFTAQALYAPDNIFSRDSANLVAAVAPVLSDMLGGQWRALQRLGCGDPPATLVVQNVQAIAQAVQRDEASEANAIGANDLRTVLWPCFVYLEGKLGTDGRVLQLVKDHLRGLACFPSDLEGHWKLSQGINFVTNPDGAPVNLRPFILSAPPYMNCPQVLTLCGAMDTFSVENIMKALSERSQRLFRGKTVVLSDGELGAALNCAKHVASAMKDPAKRMQVEGYRITMVLPNSQGFLVPAQDLLFCDTDRLREEIDINRVPAKLLVVEHAAAETARVCGCKPLSKHILRTLDPSFPVTHSTNEAVIQHCQRWHGLVRAPEFLEGLKRICVDADSLCNATALEPALRDFLSSLHFQAVDEIHLKYTLDADSSKIDVSQAAVGEPAATQSSLSASRGRHAGARDGGQAKPHKSTPQLAFLGSNAQMLVVAPRARGAVFDLNRSVAGPIQQHLLRPPINAPEDVQSDYIASMLRQLQADCIAEALNADGVATLGADAPIAGDKATMKRNQDVVPKSSPSPGGPSSSTSPSPGNAGQRGTEGADSDDETWPGSAPAGAPGGTQKTRMTLEVEATDRGGDTISGDMNEILEIAAQAVGSTRPGDRRSIMQPPKADLPASLTKKVCVSYDGRGKHLKDVASIGGVKILLAAWDAPATAMLQDASKHHIIEDLFQHIAALSSVFGIPNWMDCVSIFIENSVTIAFNLNQSIYFNAYAHMQYFHSGRNPPAAGDSGSLLFWFTTACHELTHNRVQEHGEEFEFLMQAIISKHIPGLVAPARIAAIAPRPTPLQINQAELQRLLDRAARGPVPGSSSNTPSPVPSPVIDPRASTSDASRRGSAPTLLVPDPFHGSSRSAPGTPVTHRTRLSADPLPPPAAKTPAGTSYDRDPGRVRPIGAPVAASPQPGRSPAHTPVPAARAGTATPPSRAADPIHHAVAPAAYTAAQDLLREMGFQVSEAQLLHLLEVHHGNISLVIYELVSLNRTIKRP